MVDSQRVFAGPLNAGIDPRASKLADKVHRVVKRRAGNPQVDSGGGELGKRPGKGWRRVGFPGREQVERLDDKILRQDRSAGGGTLAEAGPVVDDRQPSRFARHKRQLRVILCIERQNADPVGVERTGAVAFSAGDAQTAFAGLQASADIEYRLAAGFRKRVGKAIALQRLSEEKCLLLFAALQTDILQKTVMVLGNLPQRRVGGGNNRYHLGQRGGGYLGSAPLPRDGDTPQAAIGVGIDNLRRHAAAAIALRRAGLQYRRDFMGDGDGFVIAADNVCLWRLAAIVKGLFFVGHSHISWLTNGIC